MRIRSAISLAAALAALVVGAAGYLLYSRRPPAAPAPPNPPSAGYVDAAACAGCHQAISETYRRTGMGRSFFRPRPENTVEDYVKRNTFYHRASERHYTMYRREGRLFQRRRQTGFDGKETNVLEKEVHFVLGSGNHARSYIHRTPQGRLVELPVGWYPERGGYWAMNPGYDRPDHKDFRREISFDCMFCHNGYPAVVPGSDSSGRDPIFRGAIPEGIDCQRCHGPGRDHIKAAGHAGATPEAIRRAILNPARLSRDRQLELCMQCHLESTSRRLPYSVRRYDRGAFSYRPGEPLADYIVHFDHPAGSGRDDKFEIAHAAYRLRRSACFEKSAGAMTCTTCHNPHQAPRGEAAVAHYTKVCRNCHAAAHAPAPNCLACHMPKRRTDDVIHVVMTDHYIQRRKPARDLLAPLAEVHDAEETAYRGEVAVYYPHQLAPTPENELYLAVAQVTEGSNLQAGMPRLQRAIDQHRPPQAEFYHELAEAFWQTGDSARAIALYEQALARKPDLLPALRNLSVALSRSGRLARAAEVVEKALTVHAHDAALLNNLGEVYLQQGKPDQAAATLRKALAIDPDLPQAYNNLGEALVQQGDRSAAEEAFRNAIRVQPDFAVAHNNLANSLARAGDLRQAQHHFQKAIQHDPKYAAARYNYGLALAENRQYERARVELEAAVRLNPSLAEAHNNLGNLAAMKGERERAIAYFRRAVALRPGLYEAHLNLGLALAAGGHLEQAKTHFRKAAESPDPPVREAAARALQKNGF